ncbi:MAG: ankyrin repeat domain-containing protein, partial [Victivallales bacterium]
MKMRTETWILFTVIFLLEGCVGMKSRTSMENSDWYRDTFQYVQSEENHKIFITSTELWCGQVSSTEDDVVYLKDQRCLRSVVRAWYGGYCNQSHDVPGRFSLSHQYLDAPLRKDDFIVFAAIHGLKGGHSIIPDRIARVEQEEEGDNYIVIPFKFDHAAYAEGKAREEALNKLCSRDIVTVETMLKNGFSPNTPDNKRHTTAFHHRLSYLGEPEILKLFIRYGADVNAVDGTGRTLLGIAAVNLYCPIILCRILLEAGADPNINPNQEKARYSCKEEPLPPLIAAAQRGNIELMQLLIEHGADPGISVKVPVSVPLGIKIPDCVTPLSVAVSHKQPQAIRFLL